MAQKNSDPTFPQHATSQSVPTETSHRITRALIDEVDTIARLSGATAVFVPSHVLCGKPLALKGDLRERVFYVIRTDEEQAHHQREGMPFIRVPDVPLTRLSQTKMAIFLALSRGMVQRNDVILCLSGTACSQTLDTIVVTEVGREFEMFASYRESFEMPPDVQPEVIERVVSNASELGNEGREGKPVGALFIVGDTDRVLGHSRQLILNPFRGYPENERNLLNPNLAETVKEFATLDGAFVVRGNGVIETCGAYLMTSCQEQDMLLGGLGTRHQTAAAVTAMTDSIAVTVSESTGTVTVFRCGKTITEMRKPRLFRPIEEPVGPTD